MSPRARRWALAQVRSAVDELPSLSRWKRTVIDALGAAIDRALRGGKVQVGAELGELVGALRREIFRLRAGRLGDHREAYRWAHAVVGKVAREIARTRAEAEATERMLAAEREARASAREHPVDEFLNQVGCERMSDFVRRLVEEDEGEVNIVPPEVGGSRSSTRGRVRGGLCNSIAKWSAVDDATGGSGVGCAIESHHSRYSAVR